jgi:hypothetical protein
MSKHWNALRLLGVYFYIQGAICVLSGLWLAYLTYDYMYLYDWKGDDSFGPGVAVLVCLVGTVYLLPFGLVSLLAGNRLCRRRWFNFCCAFAALEFLWAVPLALLGLGFISMLATNIWVLPLVCLPWSSVAAAILAFWILSKRGSLDSFRHSPSTV